MLLHCIVLNMSSLPSFYELSSYKCTFPDVSTHIHFSRDFVINACFHLHSTVCTLQDRFCTLWIKLTVIIVSQIIHTYYLLINKQWMAYTQTHASNVFALCHFHIVLLHPVINLQIFKVDLYIFTVYCIDWVFPLSCDGLNMFLTARLP